MTRCKAINENGIQCKSKANENALYCSLHWRKNKYFEKQIEHEYAKNHRFYSPYIRIGISIVFFILVLILDKEFQIISKYIDITPNFERDFFLFELQIWATLTGFYVALIIIAIQIIGTERSKFIDTYQDKLEKITYEVSNSPEIISPIRNRYQELIIELDIQLRNMIGNLNVPDESKIEKFRKEFRKFGDENKAAHEFIFLIDLYQINIMRIIRKSNNSYLASVAIKKSVSFLTSLFIFIGYLALNYVAFGIVDKQDIFPNFNNPIILATLLYSIFFLINFRHLCLYYIDNLRRWK